MSRWREYLTTLILAILFALFVRHFVITAYKVPTGSMQPSLKPGDFIFTSRMSYGIPIPFSNQRLMASLPQHGDVVVFSYPKQPSVFYVKRVIGLPGDRIQLLKGRLILNEVPLSYEKLSSNSDVSDNPSPDLFDIYHEGTEDSGWRVIFQKKPGEKDFGPLIVPPGEVFLLGDNRDTSDDSRYWGTVPMSHVVGKVALIWLSFDWQKKWGADRYPSVRWERVFLPVH